MISLRRSMFVLLALALSARAHAESLATFSIDEPLGIDWSGEWLRETVALGPAVDLETLSLMASDGTSPGVAVPAQFTRRADGACEVLFRADLRKKRTATFAVVAVPPSGWSPLSVSQSNGRMTVANRYYELDFDGAEPLPANAVRAAGGSGSLALFEWPAGVAPGAVRDTWTERGPARAVLVREFDFGDRDLRYRITFDFRAEDPWIDVVDEYRLGEGRHLSIDLRALDADTVYHPHTYNARTFKPDGRAEDSTLQPPQHPIATLGPIWRDIWFGGGPFAFVYRAVGANGDTNGDSTGGQSDGESGDRRSGEKELRAAEESSDAVGLGFAAVRGSQWETPDGITPESQNLEIHGDATRSGQVTVRLPGDGGTRHWALVVGSVALRQDMGRMVRSHADTPLQKVREEWILDWPSEHASHSIGLAMQWLDYFNKHSLNPTTFPRRINTPRGPVKSRDLAVLAYQFSNPDYWPGPKYKWRIGNPNFHTDMYSVVLEAGLAMPDHPHAARWVRFGVEETYGNLMRDSFPGGAWAESLSYAKFFFDVADYAKRLHDAGAAPALEEWPRLKEVALWLASLHTPIDPRYGTRQIAPIGDTSPGNYVEQLNRLGASYRGIDDAFARSLERFPAPGPDAVDLSSRAFYGFGAMLRGSAYDAAHESFVTVKAGPARNHYQGDELSFFFASLSTPLAIDYACHYSPRPWSASMHNRPDIGGHRPVAVARARAMRTSPAADVFVADERTWTVNEVPMEPHHTTKPGWNYPWRMLDGERPWTMRRYTMLVKHDPKRGRLADFLVIRDEIDSPETPWWNLHLLVRELERRGDRFVCSGQLGVDVDVHVLSPGGHPHEDREWGWSTGKSAGRRTLKGKDYEAENFGEWIPEDFVPGTWKGGEAARWLRLRGAPGRSHWLVALVPYRKGTTAPTVERLDATSLRVRLGDEVETIHLGTDGAAQASIERGGERTVLLAPGEVRPWSELEFPGEAPRNERVEQAD